MWTQGKLAAPAANTAASAGGGAQFDGIFTLSDEFLHWAEQAVLESTSIVEQEQSALFTKHFDRVAKSFGQVRTPQCALIPTV